MPAHKVKLIVNPNADLGRAWHAAADLRPLVESYGGLVAVIQTILFDHDAPLMQVHTDRESWESAMHLLVLGNGNREGGGFHVTPQAVPDDGVLNDVGVGMDVRQLQVELLPGELEIVS
jgi:diacylglycerol kinase family enzyme